MTQNEVADALKKFSEYLKANGVYVTAALFIGEVEGKAFAMNYGAPELQELGMAHIIAGRHGYVIKGEGE